MPILDRLKAKINSKKYGHIISLGHNCEVAFQFLKHYKFLDSSLLNWVYIYSINDLINFLKDIDQLFSNGIMHPDPLYECKNTHIRFHGKAPMDLWLNDEPVDDKILQEDLAELKERTAYLKNKFKKTLCDKENNLFIFKLSSSDIAPEDAETKIQELFDALKICCSNDFSLLIVMEADFYKKAIKKTFDEKIFLRTVKHFAPVDDVTNKQKSDMDSWALIFDEFRPKYKIKKKGKFKFDKIKIKNLVSVIIPAYNHENYVQEAIQSVIEQTYQNIELIIVDDGSTDNTWAKINEMKEVCEKRFVRVVFETQPNEGTCSTLNRLLELSQGEYVHFLASDDKFTPTATEALHKFLSKNPDYALAVGNNEFIDSESKRCFWDKDRNNVYDEKEAADKTFVEYLEKWAKFKFSSKKFGTYPTLYISNYIPNGYLVRKSIFEKIHPFTPKAPLEDWFLMLQISKYSKMKYLDEILFSYRWHNANTMKQETKMQEYGEKTRNYEEEILATINKNEILKDAMNVIKNGSLYKRQGIKFIFEILTYRKNDKKIKSIKILGLKILTFKKR